MWIATHSKWRKHVMWRNRRSSFIPGAMLKDCHAQEDKEGAQHNLLQCAGNLATCFVKTMVISSDLVSSSLNPKRNFNLTLQKKLSISTMTAMGLGNSGLETSYKRMNAKATKGPKFCLAKAWNFYFTCVSATLTPIAFMLERKPFAPSKTLNPHIEPMAFLLGHLLPPEAHGQSQQHQGVQLPDNLHAAGAQLLDRHPRTKTNADVF